MTLFSAQSLTTRLSSSFPKAQTPSTLLRSLSSGCITFTPTTSSRLYTLNHSPFIASSKTTSRVSLKNPLKTPRSPFQCRHATTDAVTAGSAQTNPIPATTSADTPLTWNDFFRLRKVRRYYSLVSSIGLSVTSLGVGMVILSQQNLNALGQTMFGLDPMVVIGLWSLGFFGLGWLSGPAVGSTVWGLVHRSRTKMMATKERDFFTRIRKYRVDPTSSSMQNPVPDYYGEKITSVQGYRSWLKDQRAFNKKRQRFV